MATARKQELKSDQVLTMEALIEIVVSDLTPDHNRIQALNKLMDLRKKDTNYFESMVDSEMSKGSCPFCGHTNHWLVPEAELAIMGIVTSQEDERVSDYTTAETCPEFAEACQKKKVGF